MDESRFAGCLLGLAVGDAMGYTIDEKTWDEIRLTYGPNGLLGYDVANGGVEVSSYTQVAAYVANGLLVAITRGHREHYMRFITGALRDWCRSQQFYRDPEKPLCWVSRVPIFRRRHCKDSRMLDALRMKKLGTLSAPLNQNATPGSLTSAIAIGMSFRPRRMDPPFLGTLASQTGALTHGSPEAFLPAVVLAYAVAGILQEPAMSLRSHYRHAVQAMQAQFQREYPEAYPIAEMLNQVIDEAQSGPCTQQAMESLHCDSADQCLAGAMYASLACGGDFDTGMILAVNHSGRSGAVGAVTGALLGAKMGKDALPAFYLEGLDAQPVLLELARDLANGNPAAGLFDDDWDHKYTQGMPLTL